MGRPSLHVAVAVLLVLAGCSVFGTEAVRESDAVDRLNATQDRVNATSSYRYDMTIDVSTTRSDERISGDGVGEVNATARRKVVDATIDGKSALTYLDNSTAYTKCTSPPGYWSGQPLSTGPNWTNATTLDRQLGLLRTGDLYHNGTETIEGREVVHLSGRPRHSALAGDSAGSSGVLGLGGPNVDEVTVDLWVDAATNRPVRTELRTTARAGGETGTANLSVRYRDYGDRVRIAIPERARDPFFEDGCPGS